MSATYVEPPVDYSEPAEPIEHDVEDAAGEYGADSAVARVDDLTLKRRKLASDFCAVLRDLTTALGFADEDQLTLQTIIDAARRADFPPDGRQPEGGDNMPSARRRFHCASWLLELYYRREMLPQGLSEEEEKRLKDTLSRAWRRRWDRIHERQCRLHLGLVEKEQGGQLADGHRQASAWTDRLTDLVNNILSRSRELRERMPVKRIARAREEMLAQFRQEFPAYAPDWKEPEIETVAKAPKSEEPVDATAELLKAVKKLARQGRQIADALGFDEDASVELRLRLQAEFEQAWLDGNRPPPPTPVPPVTNRADTPKTAAADAPTMRTNLSASNGTESAKPSAKAQTGPKVDPPQLGSCEGAAERVVEVFQSIGATRFKVVFISRVTLDGKYGLTDSYDETLASLSKKLPAYLRRSDQRLESLCLRPRDGMIVQVDDCDSEVAEKLRPFAFLVIETSPGNFQVWLALPLDFTDAARQELRERLLRRLNPKKDRKLPNGGAFNSLRLPGSINAKQKYVEKYGSFPRVRLIHAALGRIVAPLELENAGLLAPVEKSQPVKAANHPAASKLPSYWPDFDEYLQRHWKEDENRPDRSSGEEAWVCACARVGWPRHLIIEQLSRLSLKQKGRRDNYIECTVDNGIAWVARQPDTRRSAGRERVTL